MKTAFICRFILVNVVAVLCFIFTVNVFAQTGEAQESKQVNSLKKGNWAIQFQINDNFSLSSFQGSSISAKYHFSNKKALRFGLTLSGGFSDKNGDVLIESSTNNQNIGISTQYTIYPAVNKEVNFFFGFGPNVVLVHTNTESKYQNTQTNIEDTHWSIGVSGIVGVEWFVKRSISFLAEYSSSFNYNSDKRKDSHDNESHTKSYDLNSKSVKFGLSLYF